MQPFTTIIAASALFAATIVSGTPLLKARDTCGAAPDGSGSATPLSQPSGIETAAACQLKCEALSGCESFLFGLVNSVPECILYSVPAADIPPQSNADLVCYDVGCSSVPAVVPTASNPKGLAQ